MRSESKFVAFLRALLGSDVAVALLFFTLALVVRWCFAITHPDFSGLLSVRGVPFVDGQLWTNSAIHLIHGEGFGTSYRPFYPLFLALFYIWTDWSFTMITCLNVLIGAISAAFIYLTARLSFNRWIGCTAAMFFAFDPSQIITTPQAATEPLGLLFFILSLYFMLETGRCRTVGATVLSGIFFGLSNLTRTLTLFCAPFYALLLAACEWRKRKNLRWAVIIVSLFTLGTVAALGPWLIRQKVVHNVWSVSTNMGEALYAATSPEYKSWSMRGRLDAYHAGIPATIEATYSFYMQKSLEHLQDNPGFYLAQTAGALWIYLNCFDRNYRATGDEFAPRQIFSSHIEAQTLFIFILGGMLFVVGLCRMKEDAFVGLVFVAFSCGLIGIWRTLPLYGNSLILATGFIFGLVRGKSKQNVSLLMVSLLVTGLANAIFNNTILYRSVLMTDWLFACFYLAAFYYTASALTFALLRVAHKSRQTAGSHEIAPPAHRFIQVFESRARLAVRILAMLFVLFATVSATRLILANAGSDHRPKRIARLSRGQKMGILQRVKKLSPSLDRSLPSPDRVHLYVARPQSQSANPPLVDPALEVVVAVESGALPYFIHYFPKGTHVEGRSPLFKQRSYDYSMFRFSGLDVIFPGRIPRELCGRPAVLVGRVKPPARPLVFIRYTLECDAIIPMKVEKAAVLDYAHVLPAKTKAK